MICPGLLKILQTQFALDWNGIHGVKHWMRVRENGLRIAKANGANPEVIELFAIIHDSRRLDDGEDPGHGKRAADYAIKLNGSALFLQENELKCLTTACRGHSDGFMEDSLTVMTCWDADRLDLGRVGVRPDPKFMCTEAAKNPKIIEWAYRRSISRGRVRDALNGFNASIDTMMQE